jgi:DNA-binding IclR family transcriptional regulator
MLREKRLQIIHTTDKTLELLEIIINGSQNLKINGLAQRMKISKEEVLLLLVTIESRGLVAWDSHIKMYRPGGATLEMARNLEQHFGAVNMPLAASNASWDHYFIHCSTTTQREVHDET